LIIVGGYPKGTRDETFPFGPDPAITEFIAAAIQDDWGKGTSIPRIAPSMAGDEAFIRWWGSYERFSASPGAAASLSRMVAEMDIRDILPNIQVPTLIIHRTDNPGVPIESAR
jgi:eukaryotic-like serine/threonine-protein kinase